MAFETQIPIELDSFRQGITTETSTALCTLEATRGSLVMLNSLASTLRRLCFHFQLAFSTMAIIMAKFASEVPRVPETRHCPIYRTYLPRPAPRRRAALLTLSPRPEGAVAS